MRPDIAFGEGIKEFRPKQCPCRFKDPAERVYQRCGEMISVNGEPAFWRNAVRVHCRQQGCGWRWFSPIRAGILQHSRAEICL